jgi:hypothetical protein
MSMRVMLMTKNAYPHAATRAARMLSQSLAKTTSEQLGGLRAIAASLGMKQAVSLSRMANGRMPVPLERVTELAEVLGLDPADFGLAVIEQRAPSVYAILEDAFDIKIGGTRSPIASRLRRLIAGATSAGEEQVTIVDEVLADRRPSERWLKPTEVPVIKLMREIYPDGPTMADLERLRSALEVEEAARWLDTQ